MFEIEVAGRRARLEELFEGFAEHDRLGLVMTQPCGALGASGLISATITAFYDIQRARGPDFFIYPDYYLFHVGRPLGNHSRLDIWPPRKEVVVGEEPQQILEAIVDRGTTRLVVEDGAAAEPALEAETLASVRARVVSCLAYSASGRVTGADVRITGNPVVEGYVDTVLERSNETGRRKREELVEHGLPVETYRRIGLDEALGLISNAAHPAEPGASR
jgi:hypothetical protein